MKKTLPLILVVFISIISLNASAQQNTFSKVIYDSTQNFLQSYSIVNSYNNGFILTGEYNHLGIVMKIDSSGIPVWNKKIDGSTLTTIPSIRLTCITQTNDMAYLVAGNVGNDALFIKMNDLGDTLWTKTISISGSIVIQSIAETFDSGFICAGYTNRSTNEKSEIYIVKLDYRGNMQWSQILTDGSYKNIGYSIKQASDSSFILTGKTHNYNTGLQSALLMNLSNMGNLMWSRKYHLEENYADCRGNDVLITENGYLLYADMGYNLAIIKTDSIGNLKWSKYYPAIGNTEFINPIPKMIKTSDSAFLFVYGSDFYGGICKIDSLGNVIWSDDLFLIANGVVETALNEYAVMGNGPFMFVKLGNMSIYNIGFIQLDSRGNGKECVQPENIQVRNDSIIADTLIFSTEKGGIKSRIKLNVESISIYSKDGCIDYVGGIEESTNNTELLIYPNPGTGIFTFESNEMSDGKIIVYNNLGQKIREQRMLKKQFVIDLSLFPKGIYIYKYVTSDNKFVTGKIIKTE